MNWPALIAGLALVAGAGMVVAGVYVLAGAGWALISGAFPLLALGGVLVRGLSAK